MVCAFAQAFKVIAQARSYYTATRGGSNEFCIIQICPEEEEMIGPCRSLGFGISRGCEVHKRQKRAWKPIVFPRVFLIVCMKGFQFFCSTLSSCLQKPSKYSFLLNACSWIQASA